VGMDSKPQVSPERRATDRRREDRRAHPLTPPRNAPGWAEQKVQFVTRYLFWCLGLAFFNLVDDIEPAWTSLAALNTAFAIYFILHAGIVFHASRQHHSITRYRIAMWMDIAIVSVCVLNDPYTLPPSILVYIMVVLGNGMRYGMRLFGEALALSFGALMLVFSIRYMGSIQVFSPGLVFLNLFGAIILVYSYLLMSRIEEGRLQLEERSRLDTLTGLMNRRALYECSDYLFELIERQGRSVVVVLADLDRFKAVNDTLGHARGDEVLQDFADMLRDSLRSTDIASRLGGDEFVLLLPDTSLDEGEDVAQRIQARVREYARINSLDFGTTIAMGEAPAHGANLDEVLPRVDAALYQSKGRNDCPGIRRVEDMPDQGMLPLES